MRQSGEIIGVSYVDHIASQFIELPICPSIWSVGIFESRYLETLLGIQRKVTTLIQIRFIKEIRLKVIINLPGHRRGWCW